MSLLAAAALKLAPSIISGVMSRRQDKKLFDRVEGFYGNIRDQAANQMDESLAEREAAKQEIKVGDTYRKYLDTAMQDPMSDFLRKEAMRNQAESLGALKAGGARAILGGVNKVASSTDDRMEQIKADEQRRKLGALQTYGAIEQQQDNKRINEMLRDARGDLNLARDQFADASLGAEQAAINNMMSKQSFNQGLVQSGFDTLEFLKGEGAFGDFFDVPVPTPAAKNGMKLPGEFSHARNPIDLVRNGEKVGEATGDEYIVNPEQARKISKESAFARQLFKKFEKRARS